jgi:hypothetical protein
MNTHFYLIDGIIIISLSIYSLFLYKENIQLKEKISLLKAEKNKTKKKLINQIEVNNPETL